MAIVQTPDVAMPIPDWTAGTFDGNSLLFQSRNGAPGKVSGDDVASYVAVNKVYTGLGSKTIPQAIGKQISDTLHAGSTTITLSDASITADSLLLVYTQPEVMYNSLTPSVGSVVLTFDAQGSDVDIKLEVK